MSNLHLKYVLANLKEDDISEIEDSHTGHDPLVEAYDQYQVSAFNDAYAAVIEDIPVAVYGMKEVAPWIGYVWLFSTFDLLRVALELTRHAKKKIAESNYQRIYTINRGIRKDACRLTELVGLTHEGTIRKHGKDGGDYYIYARVI